MKKHTLPNVLFICSRNQWRSPTAEMLYREDPRINVRSRGTSPNSKQRLSLNDILWATLILVMESKHKQMILSQYQQQLVATVMVLDIPDEYQYMDEELQELLIATIDPILDELCQLD